MSLIANARNQFHARVSTIVEAPVLSEIEVRLPDGQLITATISTRQIEELDLKVGGSVVAFLKASSVSIALI